MITSLSLTDLGVIQSAELELGEGLHVLTGETGAGKTMVVTSLQLLLGARGSADLVRSGSERAQVSVEFSGDAPGTVLERVEQAGGVVDDDIITMARVLSAAGRSRAALGGASVPIATSIAMSRASVGAGPSPVAMSTIPSTPSRGGDVSGATTVPSALTASVEASGRLPSKLPPQPTTVRPARVTTTAMSESLFRPRSERVAVVMPEPWGHLNRFRVGKK